MQSIVSKPKWVVTLSIFNSDSSVLLNQDIAELQETIGVPLTGVGIRMGVRDFDFTVEDQNAAKEMQGKLYEFVQKRNLRSMISGHGWVQGSPIQDCLSDMVYPLPERMKA